MLAVAVKFTAVLLLPFLLIALVTKRRRLRFVIVGAVLAAVPMIALSLALFGLLDAEPVDQSSLLTDFSIPNIVGLVIGIGGGTPGLLKVAIVVRRAGRRVRGLPQTATGSRAPAGRRSRCWPASRGWSPGT